jgi:hypothetical protein
MGEYRKMAKARTKVHNATERRTKQVLRNRDLVGYIAEGEFGKRYGYEPDKSITAAGDSGYDFRSRVDGRTIDIKSTERANGRLMVGISDNDRAYYFVLAVVDSRAETATFAGYTTWDKLQLLASVEWHHGRQFYAMNQRLLDPMPEEF